MKTSAVTVLAYIVLALVPAGLQNLWPTLPGGSLSVASADDGDGGGGGDDGGSDSGTGSDGGSSSDGGGGVDDSNPAANPAPRLATLNTPGGRIVRGEILGIDLTRAQINEVTRRGFVIIRSQSLTQIGVSYNRLAVPPGLTEARAVALLNREVANGRFDFNHSYRLTQGSCTGERCVGRARVDWQAPGGTSCRLQARIGMVDTAVSRQRSGVDGARLRTRAFHGSTERSDPAHGSAVAALLAGSAHAVPGLLPHARLYAADVFASVQGGGQISTAAFIAEGIDWLLSQRVEVINISLAGPENPLLKAAVQRAHAKGVPIVASAGNDGPRAAPAFPAAYPESIAVTAVDTRRRLYTRANRGQHITLAAPGVDVYSPTEGQGGYHTGTSFAAPFVTASVAMLRASGAADITQALRRSAIDLGPKGRDPLFGWGLLRAPDQCP